jgi:DNA polymerase III subunit gamma/tau
MDNKYMVFTRKWRPNTFEEIIGQNQVTIPLMRAIETGRIMHAYLFSGPRGVGKTTTARVFAKALNCEKGPTAHPCGQCGMCREIKEGSSLDVIEIDGASNRGIDEIRELREHVGFGAARGRYKVYIIDEVHMLTNEAFNAFLKTLEEPPQHVIFIFATTDPTRIPQTILSRCQHFRFKRMPVNLIIENLKMIAGKENIKYEEEVLFMIAKSADGALRDAQRIFDQAVTYAKGETLTEAAAGEMLGEIRIEVLIKLLDSMAEKDVKSAISIIEDIFDKGFDLKHFLKDLTELLRNMIIIKTVDSRDMVSIGDEEYEHLKRTCGALEKKEILYILQKALEAGQFIERTSIPDIALETFVLDAILNIRQEEPVLLAQAGQGKAQPAEKTAVEPAVIKHEPGSPKKAEDQEGHMMIESIEEKEDIKKLTKEIIEKRWDNIVQKAKEDRENTDMAQALGSAGVISYEDPNLFLIGDNPFMTKILADSKDKIKEMINNEFKANVILIIQDKEEYKRKYQVKKNVVNEEAKNHPLVKDLSKIFKISEVEIKKNK